MNATHTRLSATRKNHIFYFHVDPKIKTIYRIKEDGSTENVTKNEKLENLKPIVHSTMDNSKVEPKTKDVKTSISGRLNLNADVEIVDVVKKIDSQLKNNFSWIHSQVDEQLDKLLKKYPEAVFTGISINYEVVKEDVINIEL